MQKGLLLVVSGPSGCGKGTVLKEVMQQQDLYYSVSLTTRAPRPGEVDGVQYHFVSKEQFEEMIARDEVLEHAEFCGNYYGTPRDAVEAMRNGAQQVMQKCPDAVSIFIAPPSMTELEKRLRGRGTEAEEVIQKRLATASGELKDAPNYKYLVVNDQVETAAQEILTILAAEQIHQINKEEKVKEVLES